MFDDEKKYGKTSRKFAVLSAMRGVTTGGLGGWPTGDGGPHWPSGLGGYAPEWPPGPPGAPPAAAAAPPACAPFKLAVQGDVYTTVSHDGPQQVLCSGVLVCVVPPYPGTDTIVMYYIKTEIGWPTTKSKFSLRPVL